MRANRLFTAAGAAILTTGLVATAAPAQATAQVVQRVIVVDAGSSRWASIDVDVVASTSTQHGRTSVQVTYPSRCGVYTWRATGDGPGARLHVFGIPAWCIPVGTTWAGLLDERDHRATSVRVIRRN